jgi:ATP/maltotriose-dependent transcriptional regulator MalT
MTLADFETQADERLILIIDDFQYVKPRANGRLNRFLEKIIAKRVNLIIVTHELYQKEPLMKEK